MSLHNELVDDPSLISVPINSSDSVIHFVGHSECGNRLVVVSTYRLNFYERQDTSSSSDARDDFTVGKDVFPQPSTSPPDKSWKLLSAVDWPHSESVNCAIFAHIADHNCFVLATCSSDRVVNIWREIKNVKGQNQWVKSASLRDSFRPVGDIAFCVVDESSVFLASCSHDGFVRIYEAQDAPLFKTWPLEAQLPLFSGYNCPACAAVCWASQESVPFGEECLAFAAISYGGVLQVWRRSPSLGGRGTWKAVLKIRAHHDVGTDVGWSANYSRPYDVLATCGFCPVVAIWYIFGFGEPNGKATYQLARSLDLLPSAACQLKWSFSGCQLAVAGETSIDVLQQSDDGEWVESWRVARPSCIRSRDKAAAALSCQLH